MGGPTRRLLLDKAGMVQRDSNNNLNILKQWQIVLFPYDTQAPLKYYKPYQITKISTRVEHPNFYTVAAVPYYYDTSPLINRTESSNFIKNI